MTEEEKYEKIKKGGELVHRTLNLSKAAAMMKDTLKEYYYLQEAYKEAIQLVSEYPDMEAVFVVYVLAGTPLLHYYQREGEDEQALHHCMQMVLKMRLLTRKLHEERSCTIFTQTFCSFIMVFIEESTKYSFYEKYPYETKETERLLYEILYILQESLKKVNPASLSFTIISGLMTSFERNGASHDKSLSVSNLNGLINQLANRMENFVFDYLS